MGKNEKFIQNLDYILNNVVFKFEDTKSQEKVVRDSRSEIVRIENENRHHYADISKSITIYNLFLLKNYVTNNLLLNGEEKDANVLIYFIFYFDFRGRFYYDSPISPTNSKYSRLIYNYGVCAITDEICQISEISLIIKNYMNYIDVVRKKFDITIQLNVINESIF